MLGSNGLVIRNVGSGRSPVKRRSGNAVTKITGTLKLSSISFTASRPELPSARWMSAKMRPGRFLPTSREGFAMRARNARHPMTKALHESFEIHRDQRLVLDNKHIRRRLLGDLLSSLVDQAGDLISRGPEDLSHLLRGKAFHRSQQKRLPGARRDGLEAAVSLGFRRGSAAS